MALSPLAKESIRGLSANTNAKNDYTFIYSRTYVYIARVAAKKYVKMADFDRRSPPKYQQFVQKCLLHVETTSAMSPSK